MKLLPICCAAIALVIAAVACGSDQPISDPTTVAFTNTTTPATLKPEATDVVPTQTTPRVQTVTPTSVPVDEPTPMPVIGVPDSSASAITSPPPSLDGINTQTAVYGTNADPNIITLGPKLGGPSGGDPYPNKTSMELELGHGAPVLAPIDMVLIGYDNRNASYRTFPDGQQEMPFDDLELCFESESPNWPGLIICTYHLTTSPLLPGHDQHPECQQTEEWLGTHQAKGHLFFEFNDYVSPEIGDAVSCGGLIGRSVKRGDPIGFAGSVGSHSMASFRFKVRHTSVNPTVESGNQNLHWVQPGSFFYWKCYGPEADFPNGVLAYPFECDGYRLPTEQRDLEFKYQPTQ